MAYSNNPNLPRARAMAMKLLLLEQLPALVVANKCGVHRSTIWRWKQKWLQINEHRQFKNFNRPNRQAKARSRLLVCKWSIPTLSSRPHSHPQAVAEHVVQRVLELRRMLKRCAEVIWHYITKIEGAAVSLSSVHRILRRHHQYDGARKNRVRSDNPERPQSTKPGDLVQMDTIHYICPVTYRRRYVYTVIDLYTRMAHAEIHNAIRPSIAATAIEQAQKLWGFSVSMIQTDNGPEFSRYFEQGMKKQNIKVRHSRLGRPNDNAHIERFNRTIQEECLGNRISSSVATATLQAKISRYIEHYNTKRIHLGLELQTPVSMLRRS